MSDLYPTEGSTFYKPEEDDINKASKEEERKEAVKAAPFIEKTIAWFDEQIALCDSVANALDIAQKYEIFKDDAIVAMDIVRQVLEDKKKEFARLKLK